MIAAGAKIATEFYFSLLLDRAERRYLAMCSVEGGMEIEQLAVERPEALAKVAVDPRTGIDQAKADEIVATAGFDAEIAPKVAAVLQTLWTVYKSEDATLVEVNPLVLTEDGEIVALDGKVTLDENAGFRHPDHAELEDSAAADPLEARAKEKDLNYVKLDGSVGIIGNGAGLVMSTLDVVAYAGEQHGNVKPANDPGLPKNPSRGAKITFSTGADGKPQTLYYFSTDLSNDGVKTSGFLKFCDTFGLADSFIKSASYLLHADSFSTIRSYIVDHSDVVVEDDSGVPVRFFKPDEWQLMAFGNYVAPLGIFPHTYQPMLHDLYRKRTAALDFGIGYRWRPSESNVLLAIRGSKTAQQTPAPQNK